MNVKVRVLAGGLAGCAAVAVSGCGSSAPRRARRRTLASTAQHAVQQATSVHVDGKVSDNGTPVGINLGINRQGDLSGTVPENGANLDVISDGGKVYVKATPEFLKQNKAPASACSLVCGRWIQLPPAEAKQITSQLTMKNLTGGANGSSSTAKVTEAGTTTVNGKSAWVLKGADGNLVDVSSQGTPYPLRVRSGQGNQGQLLYSQWNSVPKPAVPPANQIINLNGLR
jgi:hypothetical protein